MMPFSGPLYSNQRRGAGSLLLQVLNSIWMEKHTMKNKLQVALNTSDTVIFTFNANKSQTFPSLVGIWPRLLCTIHSTAYSICVCASNASAKDRHCASHRWLYEKMFPLFSALCWDKSGVWLISKQPGWKDVVWLPGEFYPEGSTGASGSLQGKKK